MNVFLLTKLVGLITMFIDHFGSIAGIHSFRIIGRLSFPLFSMLMAYGTKHTKNPEKRILKIFITFIISEPIYYLLFDSTSPNILLGYLIFAIGIYLSNKFKLSNIRELFLMLGVTLITIALDVDYGFYLPLITYIFYKIDNPYIKSLLFGLSTLLACFINAGYRFIYTSQIYSLLCIPIIIMFYIAAENKDNVKRHTYKNKFMNFLSKNIFYILYPLHLAILLVIRYMFYV